MFTSPYVLIDDWLAAYKTLSVLLECLVTHLRGNIEASAPVSTKKGILVFLSIIVRRFGLNLSPAVAPVYTGAISFPFVV